MFLISPSDLKTHLYPEVTQEITRDDTTLIQSAIDCAIAEAKGFLSAYDLPKLFGSTHQDPIIIDPNLQSKLKDLCVWQLIILSNPGIEYEAAKRRYDYAITHYFKPIQKGLIVPDGWPFRDASTQPAPPPGNAITWNSNPKRDNYF